MIMKRILFSLILGFVFFTQQACTSNDINKQSKAEAEKSTVPPKADACMPPVSKADSAKFISKQIRVSGDVENEMVLNVDSLKQMNVKSIENFSVVCQSGSAVKENYSCKGVLLKDILEKAKIKQQNHKDRNFYIVARATDNYKATFSWAEIFNNPTGENVFVLFEENGEPIKEQGSMILICKNDIKTGPRHVYWLSSIEVYRVD